jgi:hypothetical protein
MDPLIVFNLSIIFIHYVQKPKKIRSLSEIMADHSQKNQKWIQSVSWNNLKERFGNQKESS